MQISGNKFKAPRNGNDVQASPAPLIERWDNEVSYQADQRGYL